MPANVGRKGKRVGSPQAGDRWIFREFGEKVLVQGKHGVLA